MHRTASNRNLHVMAILGHLFFLGHSVSGHSPRATEVKASPAHPPTHLLPRKQTHARLFSVDDGVPLCVSKHKTHVHSAPALRSLHRETGPGVLFLINTNEECLFLCHCTTQALRTVLYVHICPDREEQSRGSSPSFPLCKEAHECGQLYRNLVEATVQLGGPCALLGVLGPAHAPA
ncbi:hypothetical protein HJG60_008091 [Phyllostomus discolor]|uniref:Uncharacterized protein n=1 Tax=Phyllostomus discolor TaxID=89673 RepID=A0A834EVJ4_9CHIR|nr:hypothetical protein HJG60_008091 [Phyllostomus discolor]